VRDENASQDWISVGFAELAKGGVEAVRVEVLAERMAVTKGGFYRRFKDRRALLNAMLETWREGRVTAIERQAEAGGESGVERLRAIFKLYSERANTQGMVDAARLKIVGSLYRMLGLSAPDADARAVLFYTFLFGQSMLFLDDTPRRRANLVTACAKFLLEIDHK
jgi:AcrR family transcriptional regulator